MKKLVFADGKELKFTVNGKSRFVRGEMGEGAVIALNGEPANLYSPNLRGNKSSWHFRNGYGLLQHRF